MILDIGSLMFNMPLNEGGSPSWGTDLGQGVGYKFNFENYETFLTAMLYNKIEDVENVFCPLGKGGGRQNDYDYVIASLFKKIFVNNIEIPDTSFVLLIVKQKHSATNHHIGRKSLKYSPRIKYNGIEYNDDCYRRIERVLNLKDNSAWFVYEINTKNQDELHFRVLVGDENKPLNFKDTDERKKFVNHLLLAQDKKELVSFKKICAWFVRQLRINNNLEEGSKTSGHGYKGDKIRELYSDYRTYYGFTLDCSIQSGYNKSSSKANYIHATNSGINLRPSFNENNDVSYLYLDLYNVTKDKNFDLRSTCFYIKDLDLFSDDEPNELLSQLFNNYKSLILGINSEIIETNNNLNAKSPFDFNQSSITDAKNLIVYGTPGCGKSYFVQNTLLKDYDKDCYIRTTFYQDYSNTDFVGQIVPFVKEDKTVTYEFNPGPFTIALNKAIQNPNKHVALVIEELNRGNAPSIFGDIFQLLDRKDGVSQYQITNVNIQKYLEEQNLNYKFDYIKLPGNFNLFATMNTSDQNVFTLDTAFKRRWEFIKIKNVFTSDHQFKNKFLPGLEINWEEFCNAINNTILNDDSFINSEDKQLGVYFISEKGLRVNKEDLSTEEDRRKFAFKVFEYLWDDVAKFNRENWFKNDIKSLDQLIDVYIEKGKENKGLEVFKDDIFNTK